VRAQRLAAIEGQVLHGIDAIAAPVFDADGRIAAVITVLGPHRGFDPAPKGSLATSLLHIAREAGASLGHADAGPVTFPP